MELNLVDCLARVRLQDQAAARSLVDHLYPLVIKIIRRHLPRRAAEEDLAQDIFVKIFSSLDQYKSVSTIEHWVSRIAVNHCLNAIRMQKARPEWRMADLSMEQANALEAVTASAASETNPTHALGARELVDKLLASLAPKDRMLIQMLEIEELSIDEIKSVTGWSATLIRVRAFRARRKLNKRFGQIRKEGNI